MKKIVASLAAIGILALSLIGGPAMADTPTPTPTPSRTKDICIQTYPYPESCLTPTPTATATTPPLKEVTPNAPTLIQPTCSDKLPTGTLKLAATQPEGVNPEPIFGPILHSNGLPGSGILGVWMTVYAPADGYKFPEGAGQFRNVVYDPKCAPAVVAPPVVEKTPPPAVSTVPVKPSVTTADEPTDQLAYTGPTDGWALPLGVTFVVVGCMAFFISRKRPSKY